MSRTADFRPLALVLLGLLLLLPGLEHPTIHRRQELRVVMTARHMVESGNWLVPTFEGQVRMRKPPLMYWLVAASFTLAGSTESVVAARMPSVLAGFLLLLALHAGGARLIGRHRAFLGALAAATTLLFFQYARGAETDIYQILFTTLSVLAIHRALTTRRGRIGGWLAAGVFSGLGFLVKGPAPVVFPFLTLLLYLWIQPSARTQARLAGPLLALLAAAAIILPWYLFVLRLDATESAALAESGDELKRILVSSAHRGTIFYYLYTLPLAVLPWGVLLPFSLHHAWKHHRHRAGVRFALAWFLSTFIVLSLLASAQRHYALLLLPSAFWMVGLHLGGLRAGRFPRPVRGFVLALAVVFAAGGIGVALLPRFFDEVPWPGSIPAGLLIASGALALLRYRTRWRPAAQVAAAVVLVAAVFHAATLLAVPAIEHEEAVKRFARQVKASPARPAAIYHVGRYRDCAEFYLHAALQPADSLPHAWALARSGDWILITDSFEHGAELPALPIPAALEMRRARLFCAQYVKP